MGLALPLNSLHATYLNMVCSVKLGVGAYTVLDVAIFARMNSGTVKRWFYGDGKWKSVMNGGESQRFLTFLDFMQAVAVRNLRVRHKIPLGKIREAIEYAEKEFGMTHLFARRHATWLDGKNIAIVPEGSDAPLHATGRNKGQHLMKRVLEEYLKDVSFDPETGLAQSFVAYQFKERRIMMDPHIHFGQPFVDGAGIPAQRLADAVEEEGGVDAAAEAFGIERDDVEAASRYIDSLQVA